MFTFPNHFFFHMFRSVVLWVNPVGAPWTYSIFYRYRDKMLIFHFLPGNMHWRCNYTLPIFCPHTRRSRKRAKQSRTSKNKRTSAFFVWIKTGECRLIVGVYQVGEWKDTFVECIARGEFVYSLDSTYLTTRPQGQRRSRQGKRNAFCAHVLVHPLTWTANRLIY